MKALDCWHVHFQVVEYLQDKLTHDEWQDVFEKPQTPKLVSLVELIEKAQQQARNKK